MMVLVFSLNDGPNSQRLEADQRHKRAPRTWAPSCLLSIHPESGDRIGEGYLLFRRCAEND